MSLYNALFGFNPFAGILLSFVGITPDDVPRFRDCYAEDGKIVVYTRTGGGNREEYEGSNDWMTTVAGYVRDEDDDFDCTYAKFYYKPSDDVATLVSQIEGIRGAANPGERWQQLFADMDAKRDTPAVARALEVGRPIIEQITAALDKQA